MPSKKISVPSGRESDDSRMPTNGFPRQLKVAVLAATVIGAAYLALLPTPAAATLIASWGNEYGDETASIYEDQRITAVAHDDTGNVYVGGVFEGRLDLGNDTWFSQGGSDVFVAKFSPTGVLLWSQRGGGMSDDRLNDIDVLPGGSLSVVGDTGSQWFAFGGGNHLTNGGTDAFAALFAPDGICSWSGTWGGTFHDSAHSVIRPASGTSFYVAGTYMDTVDFGDGESHTSSGETDFFLLDVKIWGATAGVLTTGGTGSEGHARICMDSAGDIFFAGTFQNTINFGTGPLTAGGGDDICLLKINSFTAPAVWARGMGGTASVQWSHVGGITTDGASVYIAGSFAGQTDLGGGLLTTHGGEDVFVASYKDSGTHRWSFNGGSSEDDGAYDIAYHNGQLAVGGFCKNEATFGAIQVPHPGGASHALLLMCSGGGAIISGRGAQGATSVTNQVAINDAGVDVVGQFIWGVSFDGVDFVAPGATDYNGYLVHYEEQVSGIGVGSGLTANGLYLGPAYPNPTGGGSKFALQGDGAQVQSAQVVDVAGRIVRRLAVGRVDGAVLHWDGRTNTGRPAATGVYFVRISDGRSVQQRRITLIR